MDIDALVKKYGGASVETKPTENVGKVDINALVKKYGGDTIEIETKKPDDVIAGPGGVGFYKIDKKTNEILYPVDENGNRIENKKDTLSEAALDKASDVGGEISKIFRTGRDLASSGIQDIQQNKPWTGIGKVPAGAVLAAASPLLGPINELVAKPLDKSFPTNKFLPSDLAGNLLSDKPSDVASFSEKALLALPINKLGKVASSHLPTNVAMRTLVEKIGPENIPDVIARMRANPRLSVLDVSTPVRQMAQKLILTEGKHQPKFIKAVEERAGASRGAVEDAIVDVMGNPVNVAAKLDAMKKEAKLTGQNLINPVVEKAKPAEITDVIKAIDDRFMDNPIGKATITALKKGETPTFNLSPLQNELFALRTELRGSWSDRPTSFLDVVGEQGLHRIQKDLRYKAQTLLDSPVGSDKLLGGELMKFRNKIVDAIETQAPGYKAGLQKYRNDIQIEEAFERGTKVFKNTALEDRPEFLSKWLNSRSVTPEEVKAFQEGARIAIDSQIGKVKNAVRAGSDTPKVEFNAEKLKLLFGEAQAKKMLTKLEDEGTIALSTQDLLRGSQTGMRLKAEEAVDVPKKKALFEGSMNLVPPAIMETGAYVASGGIPGLGTAAYIGGSAVKKAANMTGRKLAKERNNVLTDLMIAKGEEREKLLNELSKFIPQPKPSPLQRIHNTTINAIGP